MLFFLEGIIEIAKESVETSKKIDTLREQDMNKMHILGKREANSGIKLLGYLF
jgi:hypothetical protein